MNASRIDLHAYRYRIVRDDAYGYALVRLYNGPHGAETFVCRTLEALRERVAELREDVDAVRDLRATYRHALDPSGFYSATIAQPFDRDDTLPASGYSIARTVPVSAEALADPASRFLFIPHAHADSYGQDLLGRVNADALLALEADGETDGEGLGWIGDSLALDLDAEADPDVLEAVAGLESYPVVDEEALSEAEHEEDVQAWTDYGRSDALEALRKALDLDDLEGFTVDAEEGDDLDAGLLEAAHEQGRPSDEDGETIARRWIAAQSGQPWNVPEADRVRLGKPAALARLYESGALRFYSDEEPVRATVPALLDEDENARNVVEVLGEDAAGVEDEDVRRVAEALARVARANDRTAPLPFPGASE